MTRYRQKALEVEAIRYPGHYLDLDAIMAFEEWLAPVLEQTGAFACYRGQKVYIGGLAESVEAVPGDWVIVRLGGQILTLGHETFVALYEPIEGDAPPARQPLTATETEKRHALAATVRRAGRRAANAGKRR